MTPDDRPDRPGADGVDIAATDSTGPVVEPMSFVVRENATGEPTLTVLEGSFEQTYRLGDAYTTKLFLDLCRSRGLLPYRHRRQHAGTINVRAPLSEHDALWSSFLVLSRQLEAQLHELTCAFVKRAMTQPQKR